MALADIRKFVYYFKYLWSPTDFENMQTWLQGEFRGIAEGAFGGAILSGAKASPGGAMNVDIAAGLAVSPTGRLVNISAATVAVASPSGNPARTFIVARPKETDANFIPQPTLPSNSVPLHKKLEYDLLVLNGTPNSNPVYPATQAEDIILAALVLSDGHATIVAANFDLAFVSTPRKRRSAIRFHTGSANILVSDAHVEVSAATGDATMLLPPAADVVGEDYTVVKNDASANVVAVSGTDLISGQSSWHLEDQYQTLTVRSVGTAWRVV